MDFIIVHARTAGQLYEGPVDFSAIKEIHENVKIPLVGNGNVHDEKSAKDMLDCSDAIMIGQSALANPFLFKQLEHFFQVNEHINLDIKKEKLFCIKKYMEYADLYSIGFQHIKIHIQSFLKGLPEMQNVIQQLTHTKNIEEIKKFLGTALF